jgi:hypothetical protein
MVWKRIRRVQAKKRQKNLARWGHFWPTSDFLSHPPCTLKLTSPFRRARCRNGPDNRERSCADASRSH